MISYAVDQPLPQIAVRDTFERTASDDLKKLTSAWESDSSVSQIWSIQVRFQELAKELFALSYLSDGWNSYESPAPSESSIQRAFKTLTLLRSENLMPKRVLPSAEAGVAFVYTSPSKNRAVIENLNDEEAYLLLYDLDGNSKTLDWPETKEEISQVLHVLQEHLEGKALAA